MHVHVQRCTCFIKEKFSPRRKEKERKKEETETTLYKLFKENKEKFCGALKKSLYTFCLEIEVDPLEINI